MPKEIEPGDVFRDEERRRKLTVMGLHMGEALLSEGGTWLRGGFHPQLNYAKCRADSDLGSMGVVWIEVHKLLELPEVA